MAMKHGFGSVEEYKANVQKKFSLLETGLIDKPSTRLLLINVSRPSIICYMAVQLLTLAGHTRRPDAD